MEHSGTLGGHLEILSPQPQGKLLRIKDVGAEVEAVTANWSQCETSGCLAMGLRMYAKSQKVRTLPLLHLKDTQAKPEDEGHMEVRRGLIYILTDNGLLLAAAAAGGAVTQGKARMGGVLPERTTSGSSPRKG